VVPLFRRFVRLRERLVPYLAAEGRKAIESGKPLMRPLCFEVDGDERIWEHPDQYLLGDDLLVAPVTAEGARTWTVYVSPGEWVDPWTKERLEGPRLVGRPAPLERIPVYVSAARAPELAPLFDDLGATADDAAERRLLEVT
jgi:alpha-glucosidase (family GH31 glycosyl hydrolase)